LEDIAASRVHQHLVPGTGAIDFRGVLDAIAAVSYRGWVTVELYPYVDDPDGAAGAALEYVRAVARAAGLSENSSPTGHEPGHAGPGRSSGGS
jgi:sugar phosphate isomerase/epimerase